MKSKHLILLVLVLALCPAIALAAGPIASPERDLGGTRTLEFPAVGDKAFGDPTDFKAAAIAGANYVRMMQSDITEDNAGNGEPDDDQQDGGWDWSTPDFEHSNSGSSGNLYGVTVNGVYQAYLLDPDPALFIAMQDVADHTVATGPEPAYPVGVKYAGDIIFLLNFAELPGVVDPAYYRNGAIAIWNWRLNNTGTGTATSLAEAIRDVRAGQGYENGIIAWDVSAYVLAAQRLHEAFPGMGYDASAAAMAEVLYQDSFMLNPGYFDHAGRCKGYTVDASNTDYWWYSLGVSGLINAFAATGIHTAEIPGLATLMEECQYDDGAFGEQYGAPADRNDRDWQTTAYAIMALHQSLPATAANLESLYDGAVWLGATQDVSGGFVYSSGNHYPEVGGECTAALAMAWMDAGATVNTTVSGPDPVQCGETKVVTFSYVPGDATPGLRGYEITFAVTGPVSFGLGDIADAGGLGAVGSHQFYAVDNGDGSYSINDALLGATPGLLAPADFFTVSLLTTGDGLVEVNILDYRMRDPDNGFIFADMNGASFTVDCTAPAPVVDITAAPAHDKVVVDWSHDGTDVAAYAVFRGLWYDGTPGVSAYPEYDDLLNNTIPTRPVDYADAILSSEWELAGTVPVGTNTLADAWPDETDRGVYYYEVFAMDAATNVSGIAPANDRATNYWLGDVPAYVDGFVDAADITVLGSCFATADGDALYKNYCDVGRTDDWSRLGIPVTDNVIDFEDLMVFAMNYGQVSDAKAGPVSNDPISLAWVPVGEGRWALRLDRGTSLKGLRVRAAISGNVSAGDLIADQTSLVFVQNVGDELDMNIALMGVGETFIGHGDLLILETDATVSADALNIDVRGADNARLEFTLNQTSGVVVPQAFALDANYPNPFNPTTTIKFALPETQAVKLMVYGVDGRRVATLLNETRAAGNHEVVWTGRNDAGQFVASGTYFYRIDAGPYSQVRKMTLMK